MCFSAAASFSAAALTGGTGAFTIWKAATGPDRRFIALAAFPALFALQQFVEGLHCIAVSESPIAPATC